MKSLYKALEVKNEINVIVANSITEAIEIAWGNENYKFYLNSELIDVNNRFRIFQYQKEVYIIKKSSIESAKSELDLAVKANEYLKNIKIGKYDLEVIVPTIEIIDTSAYVITKYQGTSLQECLYSKEKSNPLKLDEVFSILDKFMKLGVLYRGFLPRNTIVTDNKIYLLDWEDVIFCDNKDEKFVNKLWETNFLLNWSYFFDFSDLKERISKYTNIEMPEPALIKYERKFGEWIDWKKSNKQLRDKIMVTVLFAEKKLDISNDEEFCIMPNDLAHLVSDLFNADIDVIFDIACRNLRNKNENQYYLLIKALSNLIIKLYISNASIQPYAILLILAIIEESVRNKGVSIRPFTDIEQFVIDIKQSNFDLVNTFLDENPLLFANQLNSYLLDLIQEYNDDNETLVKTDNLEKYIQSIKSVI